VVYGVETLAVGDVDKDQINPLSGLHPSLTES